MSQKNKNIFLSIIAGVLIFVFSAIIIAIATYCVLSVFCKDYLTKNNINLDGVFVPLSYVLSFMSVVLGAWSIYKATRSDNDIKTITNSVSIIKAQQDTIISLAQVPNRSVSAAPVWNPDTIVK